MAKLIDKALLLLICLSGQNFAEDLNPVVISVIFATLISSINSYFDNERIKIAFSIGYLLLCIIFPASVLFVPLIAYDFVATFPFLTLLSSGIAFISFNMGGIVLKTGDGLNGYRISGQSMSVTLIFAAGILAAYILANKTNRVNELKLEFNAFRDNSKELSMVMESRNRALIENQDYEVKIATLNERARIARDIHDSVGHTLSAGILHLTAMIAVEEDKEKGNQLAILRAMLSESMSSVRESIHNLKESSLDFEVAVNTLADNFTFCKTLLQYEIYTEMPLKIKYCFLYIIKESLTNITKHSNATEVKISVTEQPGFFQLVVNDNGDISAVTKEKLKSIRLNSPSKFAGIGLMNMSDRVLEIGGHINFICDRGFKIFVSVPRLKE